MSERVAASPVPAAGFEPRFRGTMRSDGDLGPIEERYGRRLMRLIDPDSDEASALLDAGRVELVGPDGAPLGATPLEQAYLELERRLRDRLAQMDEELDSEFRALSDCLDRVRDRERRCGRRAG
ncbi:hypothetical protein ABI59_05665 [Acidobacteria bacterium Mor1]|nr:hypothetical protein ABI59_05665 [Acidobacteria bacterium Mor1]